MGYQISALMNLPNHFRLYFFLVGDYRSHSPINELFRRDFSVIAERIGCDTAIIARNIDIEMYLLKALRAYKKVADSALERIRRGSPALIILDKNAMNSIKKRFRPHRQRQFFGNLVILFFDDLQLAYPNTNMLIRDISEFSFDLNHNLTDRVRNAKQMGLSMRNSDSTLYSDDGLSQNLHRALANIQGNPLYRGCLENEVNDALRDNLSMVYAVQDQTRRGISESGQGPGELDLLIFDDNRMPLALIEALRLNSVDSTQLHRHIRKALVEYNTFGLRHIFLCIYYTGASFDGFWDRLYSYLECYNYQFLIPKSMTDIPHPHTEVHHAKLMLTSDCQSVHVHFYAIHLPAAKDQ